MIRLRAWSEPLPTISVDSLVALAALGLLVIAALIANVALVVAAGILAILLGFVILRHPTAIAYVALGWLVFEKALGQHVGSLDNSISTAGDGLLVLGLVWAMALNLMRRRDPVFTFGPIVTGLFAFVAFGIVSTVINNVPMHVALLGLLSTLHSLLILLIIINIGISALDVHRFVLAAVTIMSVAALIGVLQIIPHSPAWWFGGLRMTSSAGLLRVDGPFEHPNSFADYLAMVLPLGLMLALFGRLTGLAKTVVVAGSGLMLIAVLFTFAREAWLALPIATVFLGLTVERRLLKGFMTYALPLVAVFLVVAAPFATRLLETTHGNLRLTLLGLSMPLILSHIWLGVGPGRFGGHVALITHTPLYAQYHLTSYFYGTGNQIDMFWTHLIAESGILGTLAYLSMIVICFVLGRRAYRAAVSPQRRAIILGLLYAIPVAVFVSFVSPTLEAGPGATLFWGLMGMLLVLWASGDPHGVPQEVV